MSGTVKTVLIVAGTAVGAFLLLRLVAPSPTIAPKATTLPGGVNVNGIAGLVGALGGLFAGSKTPTAASSAPAVIDTPGGFYVTPAEAKNIADYDAQPGAVGIAGLDF